MGGGCDLGRVATRNQNLCEKEKVRVLYKRKTLATGDSQSRKSLEAFGRGKCDQICTRKRPLCGEWCGGARRTQAVHQEATVEAQADGN